MSASISSSLTEPADPTARVDPTTPLRPRSFSGFGRRIDGFILFVAFACVLASSSVAVIEVRHGIEIGNRAIFAIVAVVLLVTEVRSTPLLKHARTAVTPSWAFTFTLMLLGSPTAALGLAALSAVIADAVARKAPVKILFNATQICLSLALGALTLFAFDVHGPVFERGTLATADALGVLLSGVVVFSTNGLIVCRLLSWLEGIPFWTMLRGTFLLTMTADAAMLAIAPIFLVTAQYSLLLLPLMGTATFFVYQTAQDALSRAYEANHDSLTQLLNRRSFHEALADALGSSDDERPSPNVSVFILDLDRFKEVNDRLGHRTGDLVLQAFAARLSESLPPEASVARLGGDEFAVLLPVSPAVATSIARRLHEALARPLTVEGFPLSAGSSIGVAHSTSHGATPSELLHAADVAMYRAKQLRSGVEEYETSGQHSDRGRVTLLADVAAAVDDQQFVLEYQPQIDLASGRIMAAEALLRWEHPVHGRIMPNEFIALAEHTDLIGSITESVIRQALRDLSSSAAPGLDDLTVAVNVSARNLEDRNFVRLIIDLLDEHGVAPHRLELEITEASLASDPERIALAFEQLRARGVSIAIDDFGTGYSSFGTLRRHRVDRIKIDRSFVSDLSTSPGDVQIVKALVELAHALGLDVVAEGVETHAVAELLRRHGCDLAQGFHFSGPVTIDELHSIVMEQRAASLRSELVRA